MKRNKRGMFGGMMNGGMSHGTGGMSGSNYQQQDLLMMLKSALEVELKASAFYWKVANEVANFEVKDTFVEAWRDEKKHVEMITVLLRQMTGTEPSRPNVKAPSYSSLKEAIQKALEGERNDYVFYGNIINTSPYDFVDQAFREIRRDEQVHAQKFQSLLIEMKN